MPKKTAKSPSKKKKTHHIDKQKMKQVMSALSAHKNKNIKITPELTSITSLNKVNANNKKQRKMNSQRKKSRNLEGQNLAQEDAHKMEEQVNPQKVQQKINIFAMDQYVSDKPVVFHKKLQPKQQQLDLQSMARKVMGENLNTQKFGDKPLKVIQQKQQQMIPEDEANKSKPLPHPNIPIPQGSFNIHRKKQIQEFRKKLPIYMKEQEIIETITNNLVTLICGQTGSGKSTQLPQFLAQKNYHSIGKIAITQPRRLATTSLARRVSYQMNYRLGSEIGYQVRHERKQSQNTFIKFMTDGILLKEMSSDPMLLQYGVIIIDEAHERKINTDILVGLLSKLILLRYKLSLQGKCQPLRLVIMSATLRVQDFNNQVLFNYQVPILNVESKMFPVTIFHQKQTPESYIDCAVKKCVKIYKQLPPGDVLIFLTGKDEIHQMTIKLEHQLEKIQYNEDISQQQQEEQIVEGQNMAAEQNIKHQKYHIFKLYSSLPTDQQQKIFQPLPQGSRKFIVSTNISETSITVPNIRYVIDSGQQKHRFFDGVWRWKKGWGSKAMAAQRSGRAGRTTHGYCYRLYSSALYANIMEQYPQPQIKKQPLESIILQIKSIGFKNIFAFPFPSPPQRKKVISGIEGLIKVEALTGKYNQQNDFTQITQLGKVLSFIPLEPRLAKMLLLGRKEQIQHYTLLICILLTVEQIFAIQQTAYPEHYDQQQIHFQINEKKKQYNQFIQNYERFIQKKYGDIFTAVNIVGEFMMKIMGASKNKHVDIFKIIKEQAKHLKLNQNVMREFYYNCDQICEIYETLTSQKISIQKYNKPSKNQILAALDILLITFPQNVCKHVKNNQYINKNTQQVYIHRLSTLYKLQHEFVGCVDLFSNVGNRKYLRYPFKITNYPLLAKYGQIKKVHDYCWMNDQIVGIAKGDLYGWQIPNLNIYELQGQMKYFYMAKFLLEGKIFAAFGILGQKNMLNAPISIIKPDNLQQKVQSLVYAFRIRGITKKSEIIEAFKTDSHYLEKQLKLWIQAQNPTGIYKMLRNKILNQ